jgi:hypothetical protein
MPGKLGIFYNGKTLGLFCCNLLWSIIVDNEMLNQVEDFSHLAKLLMIDFYPILTHTT